MIFVYIAYKYQSSHSKMILDPIVKISNEAFKISNSRLDGSNDGIGSTVVHAGL